jgi:hypothetical protein
MLGRKSFRTAAVVTSGIELAEKIQKGQFPDRHALRTHGNNAGNLAGRPGCESRLLLIDEVKHRLAPDPATAPIVFLRPNVGCRNVDTAASGRIYAAIVHISETAVSWPRDGKSVYGNDHLTSS